MEPAQASRLKSSVDFKGSPGPLLPLRTIKDEMALRLPSTFTPQRLAAWACVALALALVVWLLAPVLAPFVVAAVLAYALQPLVRKLQALMGRRVPAIVSVVLVELLALLSVLGLALLLVPILARELPLIQQQLPLLIDRLQNSINPWLSQTGWNVSLDMGSLKAQLVKYLSANSDDLLASALSSLKLGGSVAMALVGNAVLIPVALFYLLSDWDRCVALVVELVPPAWRPRYDEFLNECDQVLGQYLRGQLLVMLALAVFYATGLGLFGLELALPIGVFTGLAVFVPYLGFGLGLMLALLAGLLQFVSIKALVMVGVVFGIGQLVESFLLTPRLVGERIGLHPLAVIFALLAFGQLFGFIGVLIALPASAVLLVALRRIRRAYLDSPLYQSAAVLGHDPVDRP
jgi:predicted PurR-regulated permease PerM